MSNFQQALKQAQNFQQKISNLQKELEQEIVEGTSGGGLVKVTCTCKGLAKQIIIDPSIINVNEKELLEDLIIAAFKNAKDEADRRTNERMQKISSETGLPLDLLQSS